MDLPPAPSISKVPHVKKLHEHPVHSAPVHVGCTGVGASGSDAGSPLPSSPQVLGLLPSPGDSSPGAAAPSQNRTFRHSSHKRSRRHYNRVVDPPPGRPDVDSFPRYFYLKSTSSSRHLSNQSMIDICRFLKTTLGSSPSELQLEPSGVGSVSLRASTRLQSDTLLRMTAVGDIPVASIADPLRNSSKGTIFAPRLCVDSPEKILAYLQENGYPVSHVYRFPPKVNSRATDSAPEVNPRLLLTFTTPYVSPSVAVGWEQYSVREFVPSPRRCFKCQQFGHPRKYCRRSSEICVKCGDPLHDPCNNPLSCPNCKGSHPASSNSCPVFLQEKEILRLVVVDKFSRSKARAHVRGRDTTSYSAVAARSARRGTAGAPASSGAGVPASGERVPGGDSAQGSGPRGSPPSRAPATLVVRAEVHHPPSSPRRDVAAVPPSPGVAGVVSLPRRRSESQAEEALRGAGASCARPSSPASRAVLPSTLPSSSPRLTPTPSSPVTVAALGGASAVSPSYSTDSVSLLGSPALALSSSFSALEDLMDVVLPDLPPSSDSSGDAPVTVRKRPLGVVDSPSPSAPKSRRTKRSRRSRGSSRKGRSRSPPSPSRSEPSSPSPAIVALPFLEGPRFPLPVSSGNIPVAPALSPACSTSTVSLSAACGGGQADSVPGVSLASAAPAVPSLGEGALPLNDSSPPPADSPPTSCSSPQVSSGSLGQRIETVVTARRDSC